MSLNNKPCIARPALFDLNPEELYCFQLVASLYRCNGCCNTLDDLSSRICVAHKTEDVNFNAVNMIERIKESKALKKNIFHAVVNINLMVGNVIQIKIGIKNCVDVKAKIQ